jgi:hypothetical protein
VQVIPEGPRLVDYYEVVRHIGQLARRPVTVNFLLGEPNLRISYNRIAARVIIFTPKHLGENFFT